MMFILGIFLFKWVGPIFLGVEMHWVLNKCMMFHYIIFICMQIGFILMYIDIEEGRCNTCWPKMLLSALNV
jgi:hypothetical protein